MLLAFTVFPSGIGPGSASPGPQFATLLWIAFPVALVLSILIEAGVLRLLAPWLGLRAPLKTMLIANGASYLFLVPVLFLSAR